METAILADIQDRLGVSKLHEILSLCAQWKNVRDFSEPGDGERILNRKEVILQELGEHKKREKERAFNRYLHEKASLPQIKLLEETGIVGIPD